MIRNFLTAFDKITFYQLLLLLTIITAACTPQQHEVTVQSPDGNYQFTFQLNEQGTPAYMVNYKGKQIIGKSALGFEMSGVSGNNKKIKIGHEEDTAVDAKWRPVYGERNEYPDKYSETLIVLTGEDAKFNLRVRAYNEGVAFRYEFRVDDIQIQKELTEFALPPDATAWASVRAQSEILKMPVADIKEAVERPLLVALNNNTFIALGEAALVDYARMKFTGKPGKPGTLVADLSSEVRSEQPIETPWRFIMAGEKPGQLLENNYLLLNLNEPNKITDDSWIKPGKVIREVTLTTQGGMACVDFAVENNLQFIEFDAGWYGNEYDDASDATTITVDPKRSKGPLELLKVIDYAKSNDVGVILYVNRRALEKQLDDVLPLVKSWGVSGLKYGFVNVGPQEWTSWLHDAVRKAADHQLMVDVHDEYRPTGYSRTYPNFMTQEGIRGDEESPENSMVLNTIFTRMIAGAGDQTNCYFASRVTEKMGSHASQLAKAVCIYSPWQFLYWYDRPQGSPAKDGGAGGSEDHIIDLPELEFYRQLPTIWDDTKVIDGYPGEYAVIARKSGEDWFIGVVNGSDARDIEIPLDFLTADKKYEATIYADDKNAGTRTNVVIEEQKVASNDLITRSIEGSNGVAIHIKAVK
ncbi:glycoside hydrolase family 97 N-terminal domain-containing protein [Fulvivirgaceae bacterium BMA12]|uniref:Glycoside hydrolase family 97 N-terminal domain-containing protein n=1 Tax=Agaribacillus aureus TaxID=3051825 RepID=A0ABT8L7H8_9BACT|nr:glycoside hydrolase family 97 N-terminal domain-containing protein [Fulvivirgaceae bacterium BMA12]